MILSDFLYVIKMYSLELRHLDSIDSAFVALVAILATAAVECLLQVVGGEQAVDDRYLACGVEACDACRYALTDVVEVRSLTAYHASEDYHGVVASVEHHLVSTVDKLEASRNCLDVYVLGQGTVLLESLYGSVEQCACYLLVLFSHHDAEAHVACVGDGGDVVL